MKRIYFFLFSCILYFQGFSQVIITSSGLSNSFSVTYPANIPVLQPGFEVTFFSNQTITSGGVTLNINGLGARAIVKNVNQPLAIGDILSGQAVKVIYSNLGNWQLISATPSSASNWLLTGNSTDSSANYLGTTNLQPLIFATNGTERMRISRAGRFGFNMNPTPASMFNIKSMGNGAILTVNRSTDSGALIELTETGGGNARIDMYTSSNANVVQIPSGPGNIFFAGGGNLGVNTTAPGNTFHVAGGARIGNLTSSGLVYANTSGDLYINTATGINIWTISGTNITPQVRTNNLALGPDGLGYIPLGDNSVMLGFDGGEVFYETNSGDMSEGLLMQSGGNNSGIIKNVSVGAGAYMTGKQPSTLYIFNKAAEPIFFETNNSTRLSVSGSGIVSIKNLTSSGSYFVQANSLGDLFISTNTGQSAFWALGGNSVPGIRTIGTTNNFDLPIIANNLERIRIRTNGNVGIGTSVPGARFDVKAAGSTTGTAFRILDTNDAISFNVLDNGATGIGTSAISGYQLYLQTATADPNHRSLVISNDYSGGTAKYGIYNNVTGNGSGIKYCIYNNLDGLAGDASTVYGEYTNMDPFGGGAAYGNRVAVSSNGTGLRYGIYSEVNGAVGNNSPIYGVLGYVNHTGTATGAASYSFYGQNSSSGAGNQYGIYTINEQYNYHSGSLGLGISVPTEKLDVSGNVEVTGEYKYSSPRTRYKSLSGATFSVESNAYYLNQAGSYSNISGGTLGLSAAVYANLDLPDNSTITGLYFYYVDNNSTYGIGPAYIYEVQSSIGVTPSFNTNFPTTASTAAANTTTIALQSNLVDTPLVVDNDLKSYMVVISTIQNTSTLRIIRCRVRYQVPHAD